MTEEEEAQIAMYMRMVEFFRQHEELLSSNSEMQESLVEFKGIVQQIFDLLSEEDHDRLLERYKEDLVYLNIKKI